MGEEEQGSSRGAVSGREDAPTAAQHFSGGDGYDFVDRVWEGYTGRWRYRVTRTDASTLHQKVTLEVLFKRRADACDFWVSGGMFGQEAGWRRITASGCRHGEDFKVVRALPAESCAPDGGEAVQQTPPGMNPNSESPT